MFIKGGGVGMAKLMNLLEALPLLESLVFEEENLPCNFIIPIGLLHADLFACWAKIEEGTSILDILISSAQPLLQLATDQQVPIDSLDFQFLEIRNVLVNFSRAT